MNVSELELQCRALSDVVDTEVVDGDPSELPSFDTSTLYVWLVPENSGGNDPETPGRGEEARIVVRGRFGQRDEIAPSVPELARRLGVPKA